MALGRAFDALRPALLLDRGGALRGGLLASLLADAERFGAGAGGAPDLTRLLGAAACLVPMLKAAPRSEAAAETAVATRRLMACFLAALKTFSVAGGAPQADLAAASVEISGHLHALSKLALWLAAPPAAPEAGSGGEAPALPPARRILLRAPAPAGGSSTETPPPAPGRVSVQITVQEEAPRDILADFKSLALFSSALVAPAGPHASVQLLLQQPGSSDDPPPAPAAPTATDTTQDFLLGLYTDALGVTLEALSIPEISAVPRAVAGAVAALGSWARVLQQLQEGAAAFSEPLAALCGGGGGGSALAALTAYDDEAVLRQLAKLYLTCLRSGGSLGRLLERVASAAEVVGSPAQDGSSSAAFSQLDFLLGLLARPEAGLSSEGALAVWKAAATLAHPKGGCLVVVSCNVRPAVGILR